MISLSTLAHQSNEKIKIGLEMDYPPFSFFNKTVPDGFDVDVIKEMNQHSPKKMEIVLDTWSAVLADLDSDKIDAIGGILYSEERAKIYDFTRPYNFEPAVVFISKKTAANNIEDLYDKKMANLKGDALIENVIRTNGLSVVFESYDTYGEIFVNLETGKNDFTIAPYSVGMEIINQSGYHNVKPIGTNIYTYQYRMAVKKGNIEVVNALNEAIDKMRETEFMDKNKEKWIKYKNDGISLIDFIKYTLYILVPIIIIILVLAVTILKREIARKTMLLQERNQELTKLAMLDPGTELYNRRRFYELADREFLNAKKSGNKFGLLMIDIDWFKKINDTYGHSVGDQVIIDFAQKCKQYFRTRDVICRFGGEEFIILLPMTGEERVSKIAERIRMVASEDEIIISDGQIVKYTISIGATTFTMHDEKFEQIVKRADDALYQAKEAGRNQIVTIIEDKDH